MWYDTKHRICNKYLFIELSYSYHLQLKKIYTFHRFHMLLPSLPCTTSSPSALLTEKYLIKKMPAPKESARTPTDLSILDFKQFWIIHFWIRLWAFFTSGVSRINTTCYSGNELLHKPGLIAGPAPHKPIADEAPKPQFTPKPAGLISEISITLLTILAVM